MTLDGADDCNFLIIMIDLASSVGIVGVVTLLVAVKAFPALYEFVVWQYPHMACIVWPGCISVEHMVDLGC